MSNQVDVKFRLKQRKVKGSQSGNLTTENGIINYQGCQRIDEIKPKYEVIGTHTGRRSFICNAISMGIPRT